MRKTQAEYQRAYRERQARKVSEEIEPRLCRAQQMEDMIRVIKQIIQDRDCTPKEKVAAIQSIFEAEERAAEFDTY